jgi:hypothetical protein
MGWLRAFSQRHVEAVPRAIDNDAPAGMRSELVDFFFDMSERSFLGEGIKQIQPSDLHETTALMLGLHVAGNPYGGYKVRAARDIRNADWPRVYDWILRLWPMFQQAGFAGPFVEGVNTILAAYGVVWDFRDDGSFERVLPPVLLQQIATAATLLAGPGFEGARQTFELALQAFNHRPRIDRDACANAYDALESAAKTRHGMPNATFGDVLNAVQRQGTLNEATVRLLRAVEIFGHNTFRHGRIEPFNFSPAEVDFVFAMIVAAILVFASKKPDNI